MPKSDSARKPKVWVRLKDGKPFDVSLRTEFLRSMPGDVVRYAPLQPPRRCVWLQSQYLGIAGCTRDGLVPEYGDAAKYIYCPNCGGRIVRRVK